MKRRSFFRTIAAVVTMHPAFNWVQTLIQEVVEEEVFSFSFTVEATNGMENVTYNGIPIKYIPCFRDAEPVWGL